MSDFKDIEAQINYLCRNGYYHSMQSLVLASTGKYHHSDDSILQLYHSIALLMGNSIPESIRNLEQLKNNHKHDENSPVYLASLISLIYAHKKCVVIDREAIKDLDLNLKECRKKCSYLALYYAALFLCHVEKYERCREYLDRAIKLGTNFGEGLVLKGWLELCENKNFDEALHLFEKGVEFTVNGNCLDGLFGLVGANKFLGKFEGCVSILNRLIVKYPNMTIPLIEKMKVELANKDWDQVLELANRIYNIDGSNIEVIKVQSLVVLCRDGKPEKVGELLEMLFTQIERNESRNGALLIWIARLFSRVCGRNEFVLRQTLHFAEKALQLAPQSVEALTEMGRQYLIRGDLIKAREMFDSATRLDESSVEALAWMSFCQILETGHKQQIEQQLALLYEIQGQKTEVYWLMSAMLVRNDNQMELALSHLGEAVGVHLKKSSHLPYGDEYLIALDPDFLLLIVKEYMRYFPAQTTSLISISLPNEALKKCTMILKLLVDNCPALTEAIILLAKLNFLAGDFQSAISALNRVINEIDSSLPDAHLMLARIYLDQGLYQKANQTLEIGVSYNFHVRECPQYFLINGLIAKNLNRSDEAIESLQNAREHMKDQEDLSQSDWVTIYLELAEVYAKINNQVEAQKIMQEAMTKFRGTVEESRVAIAHADFILKNDQGDSAFEMLERIKPGDPYYLQAHTKLANLYLKNRRDRSAFTKCFREVVENCPGAETFVLLGDAYMSILELDLAIESYQQALNVQKMNPDSVLYAALTRKMSAVLISTFRYEEAMVYLKDAIKNPINIDLKFDLAELYVKLDRFSDAERLLEEEISKTDVAKATGNIAGADLVSLATHVKQLLLLSQVRENGGKFQSALTITKEARDLQQKIQRFVILEQGNSSNDQQLDGVSNINKQKQILADICERLAQICVSLRDFDQAVQHYKEALVASPDNREIQIALAKLYMQNNNIEQCEVVCEDILRLNPDNEAASIIMADLAFRKVEFSTAAHHLKQLLLKQTTNWIALSRLIEVARRLGILDEIGEFLKRAEKNCDAPVKESGYAFCNGLYEWYLGNLNAALRSFNRARLDQEWGQRSIYNMIEICLNPDDELLGGDLFTSDGDGNLDSRLMALEMADRLHKELQPRSTARGVNDDDGLSHKLLKNFILLATKHKSNVERALQEFTAFATQETYKDHVGPILGMALACTLLKQGQRARNHLKRVVKNVWSYEDAEYLERCWLLLADNYLQSSKFEIAGELLKRVLQHNRSCVKAYEYVAYIAEKDQNYKEAAYNYSQAWKLCGKLKPSIGYRLAHTYLKSKQYADAIDVATQILQDFPEYPKIKKDILDKARNNLRT